MLYFSLPRTQRSRSRGTPVVDIRKARRGSPPPNNFRLAKCDARFISSSSHEAIKNNVKVSVLACDCFFKLCRTGV